MRCLTLADALAARGASCHFLSREGGNNLMALVCQRGHRTITLPSSNMATDAHAYRLDWCFDSERTLEAMADLSPAWLVVDHYGIDAKWEHKARLAARKIMVIDDLADRPHDCNLLLDQTMVATQPQRYDELLPDGCLRKLGPAHVMLRPEFELTPRPTIGQGVRKVHVYIGSNDQTNQTSKVVEALAEFPQLSAVVILGHAHPYAEQILGMAHEQRHIEFRLFDTQVAHSMRSADLGIGVCGMAAWERCAASLPSLVTITAENQRPDALALEHAGALEIVGDANSLTAKDWVHAIGRIVNDNQKLAAMSQSAYEVVAGHSRNFSELVDLMVFNAH
jgi:UDP-2,4-diacetamido-2,4,6-trideoxy-beta-L-altropyranose hydrolase